MMNNNSRKIKQKCFWVLILMREMRIIKLGRKNYLTALFLSAFCVTAV